MRIVLRASGALGVLALLLVGDLSGQGIPVPPPPGRREIPNVDISPNGAWRAKARRVQQARSAALARKDLRFLNAPSTGPSAANAVNGTYNLPIVFIAYSDTSVVPGVTPVIGDTSLYRSLFFDAAPATRPYSVKSFYEQLSRGHITIQGDMYGWITTPYTYAFVGNNCAAVFCSGFTTRLGAMFRAALDSLNGVNGAPQVNWGQFDNDGPDGTPNSSDDDGYVDFVTFVHPSLGGECGGPSGGKLGNRIWAHRWTLAAVSGSAYVTRTPRAGSGFIRINDYTVQSARGGNSSCSAGAIMPIGTVAHETGHAFGLPDLYATAGLSEGVGEWSLMGSGNYTIPSSPAAYDAWSLLTLGWVKVDTLKTSRTVTLSPIQTSDTVLLAPIAGSDQYLILENRAFLQSDTAQMVLGFAARKLPGLLIWQIDASIVTGGLASNTVNSGAIEGVRLLQADGLNDLHAGSNRGDMGDSYPGATTNRTLGLNSNPAARTNEGAPAGFIIDSIFQVSTTGPVVFRFNADTVPVPVAVTYDQATNAILGLTPLSSPQATYLDQVGNNNAVYDLGDYLAYLKANAIVPAPDLLRRVMGGRPLAAPTKEK